jgi:hypothetical protein
LLGLKLLNLNQAPAKLYTDETFKITPLFENALVLVRLNHVATVIVNANHGIM